MYRPASPRSAFPDEELQRAKGRLGAAHPDGTPVRSHVQHCFDQLVRFALMGESDPQSFQTCAAQFGLNLGRAQEMLGAPGGVDAWWRRFEPLLVAGRWATLIGLLETYIELLGLERPPALAVRGQRGQESAL